MNRPLKVLHLLEGLGSGGAERLLYTNLKHLDRASVESAVMTVFSGQDYWKRPIEGLGVQVTDLGLTRYLDIPRGVARLRRYINEYQPDLIHTHLFAANVVGRIAGRLTRTPVISSIHSPEYEPEAVSATPRAMRKIAMARLLDGWSARVGCTRMIAVSDFVKQSVARNLRFPLEKISVIRNPVDLDFIHLDFGDGNDVERTTGRRDGTRSLVNVGRLSPEKGFIAAVEALPTIVDAVPNVRLVSVGSLEYPAYKQLVLDRVNELGLQNAVDLLGERSDISSILADCDVFVFPSVFEGLGIALVEAMAAGCACVVSDIRPFDEFLINDANALIVPPDNSDRLANAIISLLRDEGKRTSMGAAARETAIRMFSPEPAARELEVLYRATATNR